MADRPPITQTVTTADAARDFLKLVKRVAKQDARVLVEENGVPVVAIISALDLERLSRLEAERRQDFAVLDEARAAFQDVPPEEIEREISAALAEVRDEMRDEREGRQHDRLA